MSSTGNVFAGTGENNAGIGATAWTNPGNITATDANLASCNAAASSQYLVARNFNFSAIPDGSLIQGITVRINAAESSTGSETLNARLQDAAGALTGTGKTASINGTGLTVYTYGSTSDLWSATLTAATVKDVDFGVRFWFTTAHNVTADYVTMAVEYLAPNTGTLSVSESGSDTAAASGDVIVAGTLAVSESGADTFSANGTVSTAGVTGTLAATEGAADSAAASGAVRIAGSLAVTEAGDTAAATGAVRVAGTLAATEGADTAGATGKVLVSGDLAVSESGGDAAAATGVVLVDGALDAAEGADTFYASDSLPPVTGSLSASEAADTVEIAGQVLVLGIVVAAEAADSMAASGEVSRPVIGSAAGRSVASGPTRVSVQDTQRTSATQVERSSVQAGSTRNNVQTARR